MDKKKIGALALTVVSTIITTLVSDYIQEVTIKKHVAKAVEDAKNEEAN